MRPLLRVFARRLRDLQAAPTVGRLDAVFLFLLGCYWLFKESRRSAASPPERS